MRGVAGGYFPALGARLEAGRVFTSADRADSQPVAIVNEAFARKFMNGANPIGVIVPCHRVVGANGTLTGYAGGLERKRWLLAHEGVGLV